MTKQIPIGTCNMPVNVDIEERAVIGRAAFNLGISTGEFIRRLISTAMSSTHPYEAEQIAEIRRRRKGFVVLGVGLLCAWQAMQPAHHEQFARAGRTRPGISKSVKRWNEMEAA
jgi:hypothetical protein